MNTIYKYLENENEDNFTLLFLLPIDIICKILANLNEYDLYKFSQTAKIIEYQGKKILLQYIVNNTWKIKCSQKLIMENNHKTDLDWYTIYIDNKNSEILHYLKKRIDLHKSNINQDTKIKLIIEMYDFILENKDLLIYNKKYENFKDITKSKLLEFMLHKNAYLRHKAKYYLEHIFNYHIY